MTWSYEADISRYLFTWNSYQARISLTVGAHIWGCEVVDKGEVVQTAVFPVLLIAQAWCIAQIAALQQEE